MNSTWYCHQCEEEKIAANASRSSRSSTSSRRSLRLKLALEELEVRNRLRMKEIEAEKDFFKQKYELLMQMEEEDDRMSRRSVVSEKTKREGLKRSTANNLCSAEVLGRTQSAEDSSRITQNDVTNPQSQHTPPQRSFTMNNSIIEEIPVPSTVGVINEHSVPVSGSGQINCSVFGGTILTPADMDISVNKTVMGETLPPVRSVGEHRSSAAICFSTPVTFTSGNLAKSLSAAHRKVVPPQGLNPERFQSIPEQQMSEPLNQKTSTTVPNSSQCDTSQAIVNQHPVGVCTVSTAVPHYSSYFGSQFTRDLGNVLPIPVYRSTTQSLPSQQLTGQTPVVQAFTPGMDQQRSAFWSSQQPSSTVQPVVQFRSPTVAVRTTDIRPHPTIGQTSTDPATSTVAPPSEGLFAARSAFPDTSPANENLQWTSGPTTSQIAARQVVARDLPIFSGAPEDWPIFYSSFQNSTETCGYSNAENLARLQRCLRGSALEAVRSRLLLPPSVPLVIEVLYKLYGKPEILINSLMKKVRNVQPPKADNLSTIISFGLAIQNLTDHIRISGQVSHMVNPMLLQELVEKLPTSLKMQWGAYKRSFNNINLSTFNEFMISLVDIASDLTISVDGAYHQKQSKQEDKLFFHSLEQTLEDSCEVGSLESDTE